MESAEASVVTALQPNSSLCSVLVPSDALRGYLPKEFTSKLLKCISVPQNLFPRNLIRVNLLGDIVEFKDLQ